jgi:prolyl 4-hydroxylase
MVIEQENFLSIDECNALIEHASPQFYKTTTLGKVIDGYRTAEGAWLSKDVPDVLKFRNMVSEYVSMPVENMEGTHIVKYEVGGEYKTHHDFFHPGENYFDGEIKRGGQRLKSALVYLNDDFTGGETDFPKISTTIKPQLGKLVVWTNLNPDGSLDYNSLHAGLPVLTGTKYIAVIWIRENKFS